MEVTNVDMVPVTVEILTLNNSDTIERCIRSVREFDDILVLDGGSTDGTVEIATRLGARVVSQHEYQAGAIPITDFSYIRNKGLLLARYDWFFFLDSDEYILPETVEEIRSIVRENSPRFFLWYVSRKPLIYGEIRYCGTAAPWLQLRFFHRAHATLFEKTVHEKVRPTQGEGIGVLRNSIIASQLPVAEYRKKLRKYLAIEKEHVRRESQQSLFRNLINTLRDILVYVFRLHRIVTCRGKNVPFIYEIVRQEYHVLLAYTILVRLWQKSVTKN